MKNFIFLTLIFSLLLSLPACGKADTGGGDPGAAGGGDADTAPNVVVPDGVHIDLSDEAVTVDGAPAGEDASAAVYTAHDIVYYESGHDFTYGEGTDADAHSAEEADAHTVVHIAAPGVYVLSGSLSAGQIAVDLGPDAATDPGAVVDLVLNGLDITCTVAPAIIFYNVYECGDRDNPSPTADTASAGANVYIADGTENTVNGSYVAKIYKSVELSEDGTEVADSEKLHKYDGALYSKMSLNVAGNTGRLTVNAENEGLDSELHLTVNGGVIDILSGNDGINTNEDGVSVTTVNAGNLTITVTGSTGEGDGIDSNGWLVVNGGTVNAYACASSGDAGIDSDMGILINGGRLAATGNMLDAIDGASTQKYLVFNAQGGGSGDYTVRDADGNDLLPVRTVNAFSILIVSSPDISDGQYSLYSGDTLVASAKPGEGGMGPGGMGGPGGGKGEPPDGFDPGDMPEGGFKGPDDGGRPDLPDDFDPSDMPDDSFRGPGEPNGQTPPDRPEDETSDGGSASETA